MKVSLIFQVAEAVCWVLQIFDFKNKFLWKISRIIVDGMSQMVCFIIKRQSWLPFPHM
jgi:hypothetical protein